MKRTKLFANIALVASLFATAVPAQANFLSDLLFGNNENRYQQAQTQQPNRRPAQVRLTADQAESRRKMRNVLFLAVGAIALYSLFQDDLANRLHNWLFNTAQDVREEGRKEFGRRLFQTVLGEDEGGNAPAQRRRNGNNNGSFLGGDRYYI